MALTNEQIGFLEEMMYKVITDPMFSFGQRLDGLKEISQPFIDENTQINKIKIFVGERAVEEAEYQTSVDEKKAESEEKEQKYESEKNKSMK